MADWSGPGGGGATSNMQPRYRPSEQGSPLVSTLLFHIRLIQDLLARISIDC